MDGEPEIYSEVRVVHLVTINGRKGSLPGEISRGVVKTTDVVTQRDSLREVSRGHSRETKGPNLLLTGEGGRTIE